MSTHHLLRPTAIAAALLAAALSAQAADTQTDSSVPTMAQAQFDMAQAAAKKALDSLGIDLFGYMRSGAYYAKDGLPKGKYGLGQMGYNRLGNEGDNYFEFGIGKKWEISGAKAGVFWMPYAFNDQGTNASGTKQIYADITGLAFAPELSFWGGQRYHRIQDVHIIDQWLMEDGDNFGAGVDGIKLGSVGTLNIAAYTEGNTDNSKTTSNAKREPAVAQASGRPGRHAGPDGRHHPRQLQRQEDQRGAGGVVQPEDRRADQLGVRAGLQRSR